MKSATLVLLTLLFLGGGTFAFSSLPIATSVLDRLLDHEEQDRVREGRLTVVETYMADMKGENVRGRLKSVETTQLAILTAGKYIIGLLGTSVALLITVIVFVQKGLNKAFISQRIVTEHIGQLKELRTNVSDLIDTVNGLSCLQTRDCPELDKG